MKQSTIAKKRELDTLKKKIEMVRLELHHIGSVNFQGEDLMNKSRELDILINEYYKIESDIESEIKGE